MSVHDEQEYSTEVEAPLKQCFTTITDFEHYPQWFSSIVRTTVLGRRPDGLPTRVEFFVDLKLKTIRYVLEYAYEPPAKLSWRSVDGDVESIDGAYRFEPLGPRRTRAACRQAVALGFWLPGPLRRLMERQALQQSVLEFKAAAEQAARQRPARPRRAAKR